MRRATITTLCCCLSVLLASQALAAKRVAFVVGIDAYDNLPAQHQLRKAVNDAHALGETLQGLGYQVVSADNADRRGFNENWQKFLSLIEPGDEAAFFFASHGIEIAGQNYLLPRDVPKPQSGEASLVKNESLSVTQLLSDLQEEGPRVSLVILDACRDNPFAADGTRSVGGTRGLARVEAPEGTFVMYSAGAGQTALDRLSDSDDNANSVFTRSLVPLVKTPGLGLQEIALKLREQVVALANSAGHKQTPAYYDQVIGRFCVAGCEAPQQPPAPPVLADTKPVAAAAPVAQPAATPPQDDGSPPAPAKVNAKAEEKVAAILPSAQPGAAPAKVPSGGLIGSFNADDHDPVSIAFSPDGSRIVWLASGGYFKQLDPATGKVGGELGEATNLRPCCQLVFSPNGKQMASGNFDNLVMLWDAASGALVRSFPGHADHVVAVVCPFRIPRSSKS
jgi:hypothetical protein